NNDEKTVKLTEKEAGLLNFILKSPIFTVNKVEVLDKLWGYDITSETLTIETHIYLLKAKFKKLGFKNVLSIDKNKINFSI
ncbi:MAG: winged helix-turn-helix domain-containing protein, partial [Rickettsiales bacterium]|nr:winged helix-turn-helix domain-containing protein [Rickettsiales bacterium]